MVTREHDRERTPEFVTLRAAARSLGVGERQLRRAVAVGELAVYPIGSWPRLRAVEVHEWAIGKRVRATPHARARVDELLAREARRA